MVNKTRKITGWKKVALVGATLLGSLTGLTRAQEANLETIRFRAENDYKEQKAEETTNNTKLTLASTKNCNENLRVYQYLGEGEDSTSIAFQNKGADIFASTKSDGVGAQIPYSLGNGNSLTANLESSDTDHRLGLGLENKTGNITTGVAFDSNKDTDQMNLRAVLDRESNQFGVGYAHQNNSGESDLDSVSAFWCHYGPKEDWGTRTWAMHTRKDNSDTTEWSSIWSQNPTFSQFSSPWIAGRAIGEMYGRNVVEDALCPERVPLPERSKGGLVGEFKGTYTNQEGTDFAVIRADLGYKFVPMKDIDISFTTGYQSALNDSQGTDQVNATSLVRYNGWSAEVGATRDLDLDQNSVYTSVQYSCPLSSLRRR